jgi:hypothetical protein
MRRKRVLTPPKCLTVRSPATRPGLLHAERLEPLPASKSSRKPVPVPDRQASVGSRHTRVSWSFPGSAAGRFDWRGDGRLAENDGGPHNPKDRSVPPYDRLRQCRARD